MNSILLVIDMLNDFVHKDGALFFQTGGDIVPVVIDRVEHYVKSKQRVIFICDAHDKNDKEFDRFPKHAVKDTWGARVVDPIFWVVLDYAEITIDTTDIIRKKRFSGFYGTSLGSELNIYKPDMIEVIGVCTSICVMDTVGELANRDYRISVPSNAVADFDPKAHVFALERMSKLYGADIKDQY
jgi:nicotinamidase-related amidase